MHMCIASAFSDDPGLPMRPFHVPKKASANSNNQPLVKAGLNNATRAAELHPEESQRPPHVWLEDLQRAKVSSLKQPRQLTV